MNKLEKWIDEHFLAPSAFEKFFNQYGENNMSNEITKTTAGVLPPSVLAADWGAVEGLDTTDLLVPKIYHQQALSKFVSDGLARAGDFCDSLTGEVLAKKDEKLQLIIFGSYKTMIVKKEVAGGKWELDEIVTITPQNASEWANKPFTENGMQYSLTYNYLCLLPNKITELPYVLSLGSTKTKVARKLNTMLSKLSQAGKPGASVVFDFSSTAEKNDRGSWAGLEVTQGRNSTPEELTTAHAWYVKSKTQKFVASEEAHTETDDDDLPY